MPSSSSTNDDDEGEIYREPLLAIRPENGELCLAFHDLQDIPESVARRFGSFVFHLNLTETGIRSLRNLVYFKHLQTLVLDHNSLENLGECPVLDSVHTLWCNNNKISDLPSFLDSIIICFPSLSFLSMMRNPASFDPSSPDLKACKLYRMPNLKILDSTSVTDEERADAQVRGHFAVKRRPIRQAARPPQPAAATPSSDSLDVDPFATSMVKEQKRQGALLGVVRRRYDGRFSEGNRFIVDSEL